MQIKITIVDKIATAEKTAVIVCGNSDYTILFDFDKEWETHGVKTARFNYTVQGKALYNEVVFEGNECKVPVLSNTAFVNVGVYAGELQTTTPAFIECERSILCGGGIHEEPAEDVYIQLLKKCDEAVKTAERVEQRADNGEFNGSDGKDYVLTEEDKNEIAEKAGIDATIFANVLKGNKNGEAIFFDDVSPIEHNVPVKATAYNLLNINREVSSFSDWSGQRSFDFAKCYQGMTANNYSQKDKVTSIVIGENSVTFYGGGGGCGLVFPIQAKPNTTYAFDFKSNPTGEISIGLYDENGTFISMPEVSTTHKFTTTNDCAVVAICLRGKENTEITYSNIVIQEGDTAVYAPYVEDITECKVLKYGKNILNNELFKNADNWNKQFQGYGIYYYRLPVPNGVYTISMPADATYQFKVMDVETPTFNNIWAEVHNGMVTNTTPKTLTITTGYITFSVNNDNNKREKIAQVECASNASAFEPYTEPVAYPINADGTVDGITSRSPSMTLMSDTQGVTLDCEYNRDINKAFDELKNAILALGGNI